MRLIGLAVILTLSLILAPRAVEAQQASKVYRIGLLTNSKVDVLVATGTPSALVAKQATKTIAIVMVNVGDPVGRGS